MPSAAMSVSRYGASIAWPCEAAMNWAMKSSPPSPPSSFVESPVSRLS